jgi:multiple sugar transport system substrate-binding protein
MRTSRTAVAVTAVALLALSACGRDAPPAAGGSGNTSASANTSKIGDAKAGGTITVWAMGTEGEKLGALAKNFEAANPGVKVQVTPVPWSAAHDKFTNAITAGTTPDAAMVGTTWMGEFVGLDALDPTPSDIDKSVFFDGAQKTTEVGGASYGVPWYVETRLIYYRTDLAKKAGITEPPKDWDSLKAMAKAMQDKAGAKFGLGLQPGKAGSWQTIMPLAWSNGAQVTDDKGGYTFDTPQMAEAVKYYQSYFTDGIADKAQPEGQAEASFADGSVPMLVSGPWTMKAVEEVGGAGFADKYDVMPLPKKVSSTSFVGGSNFAVFKASKNKATAWKFVQYLSDPKTQVTWYQQSTDLPSIKSAWDDPALKGDAKLAKFGAALETAKAPPAFATWEEVAGAFDSEMEKVMKTGEDPAAALKAVQAKAQSIGTGK